jgi:hypothetical protein
VHTTVFSHIVQKRLSRENENVATEALAYILGYSKEARTGMMKLLRGVVPEMPDLRFQTQETEGNDRPDMWGYDKAEPRVFIENKFWANLTENQPVSYLKRLDTYRQPTLLLVVVPDARELTLWRQLSRRLKDAGISTIERGDVADIVSSVSTDKGPVLALTSWTRLISVLERETMDDQRARSDLLQLRSLCKAADTDVPISSTDVSDQRTPALILQLSSVVQASVDLAENRGVLYKGRFKPQADWERIGRYARFSDDQGVGVWVGIHFGLWKSYGETPLWAVFSGSEWGRAREVRALLEPWAAEKGIRVSSHDGDSFVVALDIAFGQEKDQVVRGIADRLDELAHVVSKLRPKSSGA